MQIGKFWLITIDTIKGPWHVASFDSSWYIVNKDTGKSKRIGPFRMRGTNYCDRAKEEAVRRNGALGFQQDDGKHYHISQVYDEFNDYKIDEVAGVILYDRGIRELDMVNPENEVTPLFHSIRTAVRDIERKQAFALDELKMLQYRRWIKRHNF